MLGGTPKTFGDRPNISGFLTSTPDDESHFASPEVRVTVVTCRCGRRNLPCCKYDARMAVGVCGRGSSTGAQSHSRGSGHRCGALQRSASGGSPASRTTFRRDSAGLRRSAASLRSPHRDRRGQELGASPDQARFEPRTRSPVHEAVVIVRRLRIGIDAQRP